MHAKAKKERDEIAPPCSGGDTFVYRGSSPRADLRCRCNAVTYAERGAIRPPGFR